ncbi:MAG: putative serine/threonine kinase anti-sigma factor [Frankiales bacterium]|nr:putative serine/threonine kinase anti-sigma factor [Frankiales bacterium]
MTLELPKDALSVPVVRRLLKQSLEVLGVDAETIHDVEIALTEACTNVIEHSDDGDGQGYDVLASIDETRVRLDIIDRSSTFDGSSSGLRDVDGHAESGRGIQLMRALVDRVHFRHMAAEGVVVRLEKDLQLTAGSVLHRWAAD